MHAFGLGIRILVLDFAELAYLDWKGLLLVMENE